MTVFHPKKPEKEVISMRIPKDVLENSGSEICTG